MRDYDGSAVLEAIRTVQAAETPKATLSALSAFIEGYGFDRIYLGQLVNPANVPLRKILYLSDWPEDLIVRRRSLMAISRRVRWLLLVRKRKGILRARSAATNSTAPWIISLPR